MIILFVSFIPTRIRYSIIIIVSFAVQSSRSISFEFIVVMYLQQIVKTEKKNESVKMKRYIIGIFSIYIILYFMRVMPVLVRRITPIPPSNNPRTARIMRFKGHGNTSFILLLWKDSPSSARIQHVLFVGNAVWIR